MRRRLLVLLLIGLLAATTTPVAAQETPTGANYVAQSIWGAKHLIQVDRMWLTERPLWVEKPTGEGVTVAVIDTGIDLTHPDLEGHSVVWRDFVGDADGVKRSRPYDDHGHGTHVAGILAGHGHLQFNPMSYYWVTGARGVAPDVDLIVAKAMRSDGTGEDGVVAQAVRWSVDPNGDGDLSDGADVINLSLGIERPDSGATSPVSDRLVGSETKSAIRDAASRGVVVVVSSGNDGEGRVSEPGDMDVVLTVGATDREGRVASFSNGGSNLDVVAPGVLVSSYPPSLDTYDFSGDGYVGMAGTSMATPVVSGVVALMMDANPALQEKSTARDMRDKVRYVQDVVRRHATPVEGASSQRAGYGMVNAAGAVAAVDAGGEDVLWWVVALIGAGTLLVLALLARAIRRAGSPRVVAVDDWDPPNT